LLGEAAGFYDTADRVENGRRQSSWLSPSIVSRHAYCLPGSSGSGWMLIATTKSSAASTWYRAGSLALRDGGRTGYAELTVPESAFDLAITAETDVNVGAPSRKAVLEKHVAED
jgi:hypothetical protein